MKKQTFEDFLESLRKESPEFVESMGVEYFKNIWDGHKAIEAQILAIRQKYLECKTTKGCLADMTGFEVDCEERVQNLLGVAEIVENNLGNILSESYKNENTLYKIYAGCTIASFLRLSKMFKADSDDPQGVHKIGFFEFGKEKVYLYKVPPVVYNDDYILLEFADGTFLKYSIVGITDYYERLSKYHSELDKKRAIYDNGQDLLKEKGLQEIVITPENKIIRDKLQELYDYAEKQKDALPKDDADGMVAWTAILDFLYEEGLNSPRWNHFGEAYKINTDLELDTVNAVLPE